MDIRIVNDGQNQAGGVIASNVKSFSRANALVVVLVNASGDVYNAGGGAAGSGGDGAINDGSNSALKATVKSYANSNPLSVVLVNVSGDAYNGNQSSVTVNKWNLTPTQDSVNIQGVTGLSGDVITKAGSRSDPVGPIGVQVVGSNLPFGASGDTYVNQRGAWSTAVSGDVLLRGTSAVREQGVIGVQIVGSNLPFGPSGDTYVNQRGAWATSVSGDVLLRGTSAVREQGIVGVQIVGSNLPFGPSGDTYVNQRGAWATSISGDVSTIPKSGSTWPVQHQGTLGVQVVGYSGTAAVMGISGDVQSKQAGAWATSISGDARSTVTLSGRITAVGTTTIAGPYAGQVIKVVGYEAQAEGPSDTRFRWGSGASGDALSATWSFAAREGTVRQVPHIGGAHLFKTKSGVALVIEHFDGNPLNYSVTFTSGDSF